MRTSIQKTYQFTKKILPQPLARFIRSCASLLLAAPRYYYRNGFFRSALTSRSVSKDGSPLPWLTYPCVQFLQNRDFSDKVIVEFGGGQSTLWWQDRAKQVITIEQDAGWAAMLRPKLKANVKLVEIGCDDKDGAPLLSEVEEVLSSLLGKADIFINDGTGSRDILLPQIIKYMNEDGAIICDDSHGYGFVEALKDSNFLRVDFYGIQAGVILENSTSIYFNPSCFLFRPEFPIIDPAK